MIVTLNEVQRACQKAMIGAGAPAGHDDDAASAAVWLESSGISALPAYAAALEGWDGDLLAAEVRENAPGVFQAGGRSAVFVGPHLIDLAVARARQAETATLRVAALRDPAFLVPWALDYWEGELAFAMAWDGRAATTHTTAGVTLHGDWETRPQGPCDVVLECRPSWRDSHLDIALPVTHGHKELEARYRKVLASGLQVEDAVWRTIGRYAHRALVPASAESRARGAGSTASDNE